MIKKIYLFGGWALFFILMILFIFITFIIILFKLILFIFPLILAFIALPIFYFYIKRKVRKVKKRKSSKIIDANYSIK